MRGAVPACDGRAEVRRLLRLREEDLLLPEEGERLREHLSACPPCRDEALAGDPELLFLPLSRSGAPGASHGPGGVAGGAADEGRLLAAQVRVVLEMDRTRRRVQPGRGRGILPDAPSRSAPWRVATAGKVATAAKVAAAAAVLAGIAVVSSILLPALPRGGAPDAGGAALSSAARTGAGTLSLVPPGRPAGRGEAPPIEMVESPGAKVYQFASASRQEATVVFVVDRDADL